MYECVTPMKENQVEKKMEHEMEATYTFSDYGDGVSHN